MVIKSNVPVEPGEVYPDFDIPLVEFANPITVTADTTSLSMTINVGEGMHLSNTGADSLWIGSGPFQAIMKAN